MKDATRSEIAEAYGFPTKAEQITALLKEACKQKDKWFSRQELAGFIVSDLGLSGTEDTTPFGTVLEALESVVSTTMSNFFHGKEVTRRDGFERMYRRVNSDRRVTWHYRYREPKVETTPVKTLPQLPPPPAPGVDLVAVLTRLAVAHERIAAALERTGSVSFS